ncbi:Alcohol dehydrogenase [NADP(+)] [Mizuhopecten yessoensis]|uniref:Alcohol dehydrogenase [NADP(+)] n=1 Tax=Mizuhopecten yessoensis TaxID=6573 RepID=A0A210R0P5_MIZYE|nr:Alcohol dehydrogenase [NADP(+)] [Mizuhopecten yessoensis]
MGVNFCNKFIKLYNGHLLPSVGLGTYQLVGDGVREAVDKAIWLGYRHIDTAHSYNNESEIGEIIKARIESGSVKREDIFLTTKVPDVLHAPSDVLEGVEESRAKLKTKYLDLVLIHHPWTLRNESKADIMHTNSKGEFIHFNLQKTWRSLETCVKEGTVKSIGLSNFTIGQIQNILDGCSIMPANLQLECHAYLQQRSLYNFCEARGITLTAYSPIGAPGRPERHRFSDQSVLLDDPALDSIARAHGKTKAQILLGWLIQKGFCVVPKSKSEKRLAENLDIFNFDLSKSELAQFKALDRGTRYFKFKNMTGHPEFNPTEDF